MGDGHFSPADIDCSHTCLVLFSTHSAHNRAVGTSHTTHLLQRTHVIHYLYTQTDRRHSNLTNGGYELRPPMGSAYLLVSTPTWMKRLLSHHRTAVSTCGPTGCLVSTPSLQSQNVRSHKKVPASHRARGETPTMSFALGANHEGKQRVKGKASRIQNNRIGSVLVCARRNAQPRELKLLESTRFVLSTVMIAVSTDGPTGCLVRPPPLSPQNIQSHEKASAGHGACCGTAHRLLLATAVYIARMPGTGMGWRKSS